MEHNGYWYLFVSRDFCCQGSDKATYKIAVGRADAPTGPFVDRDGAARSRTAARSSPRPRARASARAGSRSPMMMALHYYDGELNGQFRLALVPIEWGDDGWPELDW